jgi:uncharacterized membrane protein
MFLFSAHTRHAILSYDSMSCLALILFSARAWLFPVLVLTVASAVALVWAGHRSAVERPVRLACGLLKLAGVSLLALCLLEPLLLSQRARPGANIFALLADNSQSLRIHDAAQAQSRGERLRRQLTNDDAGWQAALENNFQVRRYSFDSHFQDIRDFGDLDFAGRASALGNALRTATGLWRGQPVAGVLLFTDGNATDLAADAPALEGCPPVYPVVIGDDAGLRDIALEKAAVSQTAFEDAPVTIQAAVSARGFAGAEVVTRLIEIATGATAANQAGLRLSGASNVVAEQRQRVEGDGSTLSFRFQIQPDKPGLHFYEVAARAADELGGPEARSREATLVNNRRVVVVDRGQEPFRVLYVGGRPNWEFKFLNRALEDDPQVHLVSLIRVARREPKFNFKGRFGESSNPLFRGFGDTNEETARYDQPVLVRLNTRDEFELRGGFPKTAAELYAYQAVILGDVEADFFSHDQILLLRRFVSERGGGFLMLGGAESFREGNYAGTPVASMLPVYLDAPAAALGPPPWKLTLTREGWLQPWTRLRATESEEKDRLESLPPFAVLNAIAAIKPGASVLATVSDADNNTYPALAAQRFGFGRTAALMVGDLWRWGLRDESSQKDLAKSWRQLVRWLVADVPARVSVSAESSPGGDPSRVRLVVKARDAEFMPLDGALAQLNIRPVRLFQAAEDGPAATNVIRLVADASPRQAGTYEAEYVARDAGAYAVEAVVTEANGAVVGHAAAGWASDPAAEEFRSLKPNRGLLEALARRTGGEVVDMAALKEFAEKLPRRNAPITETWSDPLWQKPLVFLCVLGCFVAEWGIRRWKGLP